MHEDDELVLTALIEAVGHGDWKRANCPFCDSLTGKADKRKSLGIHAGGGYICHKCGTKGHLHESDEWTPMEAKEGTSEIDEIKIRAPEGFIAIGYEPAKSSWSLRAPVEYMRNRGIPDDTVRDALIGACLKGYWRERIIIPVLSIDRSEWLGFIARDWTNKQEMRYLYPKGMHRGEMLFEQRVLDIETEEPALVVEGGFDALPYFGRSTACMGKPSRTQVDILKKSKRPIAVCLDHDAAAQSKGLSVMLRRAGVKSGYIELEERGLDPCNLAQKYGPDWLLERAHKCIK